VADTISHIQYTRDLRDSQVKNECVKFHALLECIYTLRHVHLIPDNKSVVPIVYVTDCCPNLDVRVGGEKGSTPAEKRILIFLPIDSHCIDPITVKLAMEFFFEVLMCVKT